MAKVYEKNFKYELLLVYARFLTRQSYSEAAVCGKENVPSDGAVLIAPNHCNTLMDAMVTLRANHGPVLFGTRADLFKKFEKPLTFLKMVPMVRSRDGIREVEKNRETNDTVVDCLEYGVPFGIFSEGTHRTKHSLLPLKKGVVRLALEANAKFGDRKPIYIVPTGLEYGDYFRYRSTSLVQFGEAINVTEFVREHPEMTEAQMQLALLNLLADGMAKLITYIKDDEKYDAKWAMTRIMTAGIKGNARKKLATNKEAIASLDGLFEEKPEEMEALGNRSAAFDRKRKAAGISMLSFGHKCLPARILWKCLAAVAGLPLLLFCAIDTLPTWVAAQLLCGKVRDKAFRNTMHFVSRVFVMPVVLLIWAAIFFCTIPGAVAHSGLGFLCPALGWIIPTVLTVAIPFCHSFIYDYVELIRLLVSDLKLLFKPSIRKEFTELRNEL